MLHHVLTGKSLPLFDFSLLRQKIGSECKFCFWYLRWIYKLFQTQRL